MSDRYFLYDPAGDGFETFPTAELRDAAAKVAIENSLIEGYWSDDVFEIVVGQITGRAVKTNVTKRPENLDENSEDEGGNVWNRDMNEKHDVEIMPVNASAEVAAALRELRAEIVAIYRDDGPANGCGQDITFTAPREEAVIFPDYEAFRRADNSLLSEKTRINPRFIKWYDVQTDTIPRAVASVTVARTLGIETE